MRRLVPFLLPLLAACGGGEDQTAPPQPALEAQPITYLDIEANDIHGPNCSYASGRSMGAVVMAMDSEAVMKLGGQLRRFTLDPQCDRLEQNTGSRYVAPGYVLDLSIDAETRSTQAGKIGFKGSVKLSDDEGQVLYSTAGDVQCSG